MIAITISTNYSDLLPFILDANIGFFKKWIFVTSINDQATIDILSNNPNVIILYWDFQNSNREFDKGGAVKLAQEYAYENFPDDWYLILDSDICLPSDFINVVQGLHQLNTDYIYGCKTRREYRKLSDLKKETDYTEYDSTLVLGFFQLYKKKVFYKQSNDASYCDLDFLKNFTLTMIFINVICNHLGLSGVNWKGRKLNSDFIVD
jgi:hypothetical protein